jgi:hypothetical protein
MSHFGDQIVAILTAIIGVAIVAVIVSNKSNTPNVISAAASAFSNAIGTAVSPITGGSTTIAPLTGFSGFNGGYSSPLPGLTG